MNSFLKLETREQTLLHTPTNRIEKKVFPVKSVTKSNAVQYLFKGNIGVYKGGFQLIYTFVKAEEASDVYEKATKATIAANVNLQKDKVPYEQYATGDRFLLSMN